MSTDPEASPFEQALRADLPSAEAEQRLRRRLLAAGLAVGNGLAATSAAAAGAANAGAASGGLVANVVGLSWGVKLGFAAAVAIPTLGLLIDAGEPGPSAARPAQVASVARVGSTSLQRPPRSAPATPTLPEPPAEALPRAAKPTLLGAPRREASEPSAKAAVAAPREQAPSQREFAETPEGAVSVATNKSTLAEETRLLDSAFAELAAGHRARAAQRIAEHEARYPQGLLSKERERAKIRLSELSQGN